VQDRCVCCGEYVHEGRQVCPNCEKAVSQSGLQGLQNWRLNTMPKAILELEMPESCKECKLGHYDELYGLTHCDILRECMPYEGRHKACPLKLMEGKDEQSGNRRL